MSGSGTPVSLYSRCYSHAYHSTPGNALAYNKTNGSTDTNAKPDLVLWQLGTNSLIRDHMFSDHGAAIRDGIHKIRAVGADVVLIDPQFAPKVIVKPEAEHMVELIATTAKMEDVDLFRRFEVMKRWREDNHMAFESFVSPDGLHMNDWSYACFAKGLGLAIAEAAERPVVSAAMSYLVP